MFLHLITFLWGSQCYLCQSSTNMRLDVIWQQDFTCWCHFLKAQSSVDFLLWQSSSSHSFFPVSHVFENEPNSWRTFSALSVRSEGRGGHDILFSVLWVASRMSIAAWCIFAPFEDWLALSCLSSRRVVMYLSNFQREVHCWILPEDSFWCASLWIPWFLQHPKMWDTIQVVLAVNIYVIYSIYPCISQTGVQVYPPFSRSKIEFFIISS